MRVRTTFFFKLNEMWRKLNFFFNVSILMQYLLSSSIDKTVRLWRVGYDNCLKIFSHSNYGALLALMYFATLYLIVEVLAQVDF